MGRLRGRQQDETGFVFFEQAIELCKTVERAAATEGEVYLEYGLFRERLGQREEARAYLERAREIFDSVGRSEEHTSELQSRLHLVCRLLLEKKKKAGNAASPYRSHPDVRLMTH